MTVTADQIVADRVRRLLAKTLDVDEKHVTDGSTLLQDDLGMDSLDAVEVWMAAEDEFGIEIDDEHDPWNPKTVQDAIEFVQRIATQQGVSLS
jgi:acyl carrier protein